MEGEGYFSTFVLQVHFGVSSQALVIRMFSPGKLYDLLLGRREEAVEPLLPIPNVFSSKLVCMRGTALEVSCLQPPRV